MIRDFDRNETELRNLRATVDMLDGGLRRFAAGDVRTTFENPFPLHFEGLRRDFNRGIAAVGRAADTVIDTSRALKDDTSALRDVLADAETARSVRSERGSAILGKSTTVERNARQIAATAHHAATIAHNARLDLPRPRQALDATLKMIGALAAEGASPARIEAIEAKLAELGRELEAAGLYVEALSDHVGTLAAAADEQAALAADLRERADQAAKSERTDGATAIAPVLALDRIERGLTDIEREADRFTHVTIINPPEPPKPHDPTSGRKTFLRLVKT
jgi:methyl-accepting chemotaxis protein